MKYSVIIPAYRCESTLETTISSIQKCGLEDFEIIIVDDGSPDSTPALCDCIAGKWENARCIHQTNQGVSAARNRGLAEAKGEYIWFFDSDDYVDAGSITRICQLIEINHPDMLIFGGSYDSYLGSELVRREAFRFREEKMFDPQSINGSLCDLFYSNYLSGVWNRFIKRSVIEENGIRFRENIFLMEDFLFVMELLKKCNSIQVVQDVVYRYRQEDNSKLKTRLKKINSLSEYFQPFREVLSDYPELMNAVYYMFLIQKTQYASIEELYTLVGDFKSDVFSDEKAIANAKQDYQPLIKMLLDEDYEMIYKNNLKLERKRKIKNKVKKTAAFRVFRHLDI